MSKPYAGYSHQDYIKQNRSNTIVDRWILPTIAELFSAYDRDTCKAIDDKFSSSRY